MHTSALTANHVMFVPQPPLAYGSLIYPPAPHSCPTRRSSDLVDTWIIENESNPMVATNQVTVPFIDAPDGEYSLSLDLPDLDPGTYNIHVGLTATSQVSHI